MKNITMRITAYAMSLMCVLVSVLSFPVFADETDGSAKAQTEVFESVIQSGYEDYLKKAGNADYSKEKIVIKCDDEHLDGKKELSFEVANDGFYTFGMNYRATGEIISDFEISLELDGKTPFAQAEKLSFHRHWKNEDKSRFDGQGNEFNAKQVLADNYYTEIAYDITKQTYKPYLIYLTAGNHNITLSSAESDILIESVILGAPEETEPYVKPNDSSKYYKGADIIIEGEDATEKNSYWLVSKYDNSSVNISPQSFKKNMLNFIGGSNWKTTGETIFWKTPKLKAGYYRLGVSFRQSTVLGGKAYRRLTVDGNSPFSQAESLGFAYDDRWQQSFIGDKNGDPYLIYLSSGEHVISLTVVPGEVENVCKLLNEAVADLGALYLDIAMITGETVDIYRDYELFSQIPDMEARLEKIRDTLNSASKQLIQVNGQKSGTHISVIKNMARITDLMLDNRYNAHRYKSEFYNCYTALASSLQEMTSIPLDIDKLSLTSPESEKPFDNKGFFSQFLFSVQKFIVSFIQNYNSISGDGSLDQQITVWINWGRDQAQVFNALIQSGFTEKTGIGVNVKLVSAGVIQAMISGKGPDCILQQARSEPVNLAMRGALLDLKQFDDLDDVLKRFQTGSEIPYTYKDGVYGLPDTQSFFMMFYRKDILDKLGLAVPETWDDFRVVIKHLARRNLTVSLPNNVATNQANVNAGIGSLNIFPTLLLQNNLSLYTQDGRKTNLSEPDVMTVFQNWTDYYRKSGVPKTLDFYNRFRTGTCPIGVFNYSMYTTLKAAAPEINGLWGMAQLPGTVRKDGTVSHVTAGSGSACSILKISKNKQASWEFLKWWTQADTQLSYSNEIEALLGSTGRIAVSNIEALNNMSWDADMKDEVMNAWSNVCEIPEYPGGYYVARSVYQSFWKVVNGNYTTKDVLLKYSKEADDEIEQKWSQYDSVKIN